MTFVADLHIHSRFSRATSKSLNLQALDYWAGKKGISVIGTGDATHPAWLAEIGEQLTEAEDGLYRLKPEYKGEGTGETRFILSAEISNIYKKDGKVRKVHNLILMPDLECARRFANTLDRLGNIRSDGRPILGLDSKDLLSICLDVSDKSFFIPAHIWTPWFSLLGSKSGFDAVEECFEDLSDHIFALETGLSSDPLMNWRVSSLDDYVLVSNSDAHSADKLGREANLFDCSPDYPGMVKAMKNQGGFAGTIEFFPEEGKYHMDGHRKCERRLEPNETRSLNGLCPVCGHPVTVGVYSRVVDLADRPEGEKPANAYPYCSMIPLNEILAEIIGVGPKSKKVAAAYEDLLNKLGAELHILREAPLNDIELAGGRLLSEGIKRMRAGNVSAEAGYDGEYGVIRLFEKGELEKLAGQTELFPVARVKRTPAKKKPVEPVKHSAVTRVLPGFEGDSGLLRRNDPLIDDLNPEQKEAVTAGEGPLSIIAGPGTGKTHVLTRRAAWLVREGLAEPEKILGVTFTKKAAAEMAQRLTGELPFRQGLEKVNIMTFHALGLSVLSEFCETPPIILSEDEQLEAAKEAVRGTGLKANDFLTRTSLAKQKLKRPDDLNDAELARAFRSYETILKRRSALDFDDLTGKAFEVLNQNREVLEKWRSRFKLFLVDEYQDVNHVQYELIRLLAHGPQPNLTVIGDPDQAIYGFRGADAGYFIKFSEDFPGARSINLFRNYRSTETILKASGQVIANNNGMKRTKLVSGVRGPAKITTAALAGPAAEAEYVVWQIERLLGGTSHFALDSGRTDNGRNSEFSLGDVAVLYRLHALAGPVAEALSKAGLPFQQAGQEALHETDALDFKAEKINLLSMHASKGLEFPVVFIIGLESGILPYIPPGKPPADTEEERRLFYVAMTRARKYLYLTHSRKRTLFGKRLTNNPSVFLDEIKSGLKAVDRLPERNAKRENHQLNLFRD